VSSSKPARVRRCAAWSIELSNAFLTLALDRSRDVAAHPQLVGRRGRVPDVELQQPGAQDPPTGCAKPAVRLPPRRPPHDSPPHGTPYAVRRTLRPSAPPCRTAGV